VKFSIIIHHTKGNVDYVHYDIWGPSPVIPKGEAQYLLVFIDKSPDIPKGEAQYLLVFIDKYSRKAWL
jgi:hypothetical protein